MSTELENSMKLVETISMQKKVLEDENNDLKSRLSEIANDRGANFAAALDRPATSNGVGQQNRPTGIPLLPMNNLM